MKRIKPQRLCCRRSGVAAVELALTLPLALTLLVGTWELGRIIEIQQVLKTGAREAARQAASGLLTTAQCRQVAINYIRNALNDQAGVMTGNLGVTITVYASDNSTTPIDIDVSQAESLDRLEVRVTLPYRDVRWINLPMITGAGTLQAQSTWVSLKNFPFPTDPPQPPTG